MNGSDFSCHNEQIALVGTDLQKPRGGKRNGERLQNNRNYVLILATCTIVNLILVIIVIVTLHLLVSRGGADTPTGDNDWSCRDLNGTCQEDHNRCQGSYLTGRCAGGYTRRCCLQETVEMDTGNCPNLTIVSRDSWGARRPVGTTIVHGPFQYFFIHHTAMEQCYTFHQCAHEVKDIQNFHMDDPGRRYYDIGYSFLIGQDGRVYEGRGFRREGAHTKGFNRNGLAASFIGNFNDVLPNKKSQDAVKNLMECAVNRGYLVPNYHLQAHRDVGGTESPGTAFYYEIQTWPHYGGPDPSTHN